MDLFEILFILLFLVLPVLSRLFGAKKEVPTPTRPDHPDASGPERVEPGAASREDTDLEDALRQIREALGQPAPPRQPPPPEPPRLDPRPAERPRPEPARRTTPPPRTVPPARPVPPPRQRPLQAPTAMQQAASRKLPPPSSKFPARRERPIPPPVGVNLDAPIEVEGIRAGEQARRMAAEFRTAEGARKALLIKEVLGPPVSRRSSRRR